MTKYQQQFQRLLRELFQFDSADLDFGIYAILNQRREQIADFIDNRLPQILQAGLELEAAEQRTAAQEKLAQARQQVTDSLGEDALDDYGNLTMAFQPMANTPIVKSYLVTKEEIEANTLAEDTEAQIYNDLYRFFSRYYDDGDFVTKRRFGQDKYALPYNGQEVHLHWANADQYYIKSGEHFTDYSFTLPATTSDATARVVFFKLQQAEVDRDNTKSDDKRFFVLHPNDPFAWNEADRTLTLNFEYRALTPAEKERVGNRNQQDKLNDEALDTLTSHLPTPFLKEQLLQPDGDDDSQRPRFIRHLNRYTARNTRDFFIHKNLAPFLRQELDYFLKNEVLNIDDIDLEHPQRARLALTRVQVIRQVGHHIIAFLAQIENFQKRLFEKRKFIRQSDYCLTLDLIPNSVRDEVYKVILNSPAQLQAWRELYALADTEPDLLNPHGNLTGINEVFLTAHPHLMLDTAYLPADVKANLLGAFDDLDEATDGVLIRSENFQALNLLQQHYNNLVKCIYIDPPYNTKASEILYKNEFKHSSWLALMENRLQVARRLLTENGVLCATIDDSEYHRLYSLLLKVFNGEDAVLGTATIRSNPSGRSTLKGFSIAHEYAIFVANGEETAIGRFARNEKQLARYNESDESGKFEWVNFRKHGGANALRRARPRLYYPIYAKNDGSFRIPNMSWQENKQSWLAIEQPKPEEITVYPIDSKGEEKTWKWGHTTVQKKPGDLCAKPDQSGNLGIYMKSRMRNDGILPLTWWDRTNYSATSYGTNLLSHILGQTNAFSFPKSVYATEDSLRAANLEENDYCLDFFAGSGTTGHAVMNLNREDDGNRKYILVEMGDYFDTVLKPRLMKVAYAADWKNGKPVKSSEGQSHMFHYIQLESYEDTLTNIGFKDRQAQPDLFSQLDEMPDYQLHYMLDFETEESATLLNLTHFNRPFEYRLKDGPVDLVATFSFLLGLRVQSQRTYTWQTGPVVCVVGLAPDERRVGVIWRNVPDTPEQLDAERAWLESNVLTGLTLDTLYINGDSVLPHAQPLEPEFKRLMFASVTPTPVLEVE